MGSNPQNQADFDAKTEQLEKAELHKKISYVKSFMRIWGYAFLIVSIPIAAIILILSECLGVAEEEYGT